MKQNKNQANQYDKIFKENIEAVIPPLVVVCSYALPINSVLATQQVPSLLPFLLPSFFWIAIAPKSLG
jgi:hypothetical protein